MKMHRSIADDGYGNRACAEYIRPGQERNLLTCVGASGTERRTHRVISRIVSPAVACDTPAFLREFLLLHHSPEGGVVCNRIEPGGHHIFHLETKRS